MEDHTHTTRKQFQRTDILYHVRTHAYTHAHTHALTHLFTLSLTHTRTCTHTLSFSLCLHAYVQTCMHTCINKFIRAYTYNPTHKHTGTYTQTHTTTHNSSVLRVCLVVYTDLIMWLCAELQSAVMISGPLHDFNAGVHIYEYFRICAYVSILLYIHKCTNCHVDFSPCYARVIRA